MNFSQQTTEYIDIFFASIFTTFNFFFIVRFMETKSKIWLILAIIFAVLVVFMFVRFYSHRDFVRSFVIIKLVSILFSVPMGYFYLKKQYGVRHAVGFVFSLLAIYLLR